MEKELTIFERIITSRSFRLPRIWSNRELLKFASLFEGDIINVSGWNDHDKEGRTYRSYFSNAKSYAISNYGGERGESATENYQIDLESDLPDELNSRFDVVLNHTTLEHIFDVFKAFENLCKISRDIVIVVVPFVQQVHHQSSYLDYWRFTHYSLEFLFKKNNYQVIYFSSTPYSNSGIYHFCIASKQPDKWTKKFADFSGEINSGTRVVKDSLFVKILAKFSGFFRKS
jgi:hypothetical protein